MKSSMSVTTAISSLTLMIATLGTAYAKQPIPPKLPPPPPVPEPASIVVLAVGLLAGALLIAYRRAKNAKAAAA
jgi:hypothetical protein